MQSRFSELTKKMMKEFPRWFKIRKDPNSVGAQFLNVFGLQYEDIEFYLQYALDNQFIGTADVSQVDIIYKGQLPNSLRGNEKLQFIGNGQRLQEVHSLKEFYEGLSTAYLNHKEIYYLNPYFIDWEKKIIYVKKAYDVNEDYKEGRVRLRIMDEENLRATFEMDIPTHLHHVWNFFDEFGLLLDTPRLYGERNREYKERLLDVFRHPANSTMKGLQYSIARELNLWKEVIWYNGGEDLVIKDTNVVLDSLEVDGEKFPDYQTYYDESGRLVLVGDYIFNGTARKVRYISGLRMHAFHDKRDYAFQEELYSVDRVATPMLQYYVDIITNQVPIMWDQFVWNESFWDIADKDMSGYGYIPNFNDARFLNWKKYKG
jgi:hypothetical protein